MFGGAPDPSRAGPWAPSGSKKTGARRLHLPRAAVFGIGSPPLTGEQLLVYTDNQARAIRRLSLATAEEIASVAELIRAEDIDQIYISAPWSMMPELTRAIATLRFLPADIYLCCDDMRLRGKFSAVARLGDGVAFQASVRPIAGWDQWLKRCEDIVLSLLGLLILSPVFVLTAIAIKLDSPGPSPLLADAGGVQRPVLQAAMLANAVADAYVVDQLDAKYDAAKRASLWLAERMEGLREQVQQSEEAVAQFRREHNLLTTTSDNKLTINEQQLSELNAKLVQARAETAERRAKYEQAQQVHDRGGNLQAVPDVVRSTVISQLRTQQADVGRRAAELASRYSDSHPQVVNARAELRDLDRSIAAEVNRIISNLKNDFEVSKAREELMQKSLDQMSGVGGPENEVGIQLRALDRVNSANKTLFESFLSRTKITQEQTTFQEREARLISPATKPASPSFPRKALVLSLAFVVGTLVGIGGAVALDMLNAGFTTPRQVEEQLGIPVLASVPLLKELERKVDGKDSRPRELHLPQAAIALRGKHPRVAYGHPDG